MFSKIRLRPKSRDFLGKTIEKTIPTVQGSQESSARGPSTSNDSARQIEAKEPIEINGQKNIYSVAFLGDGKHVVSGGWEGKIRRWRVEDGKEVKVPVDTYTGNAVSNIAVSRDGKWLVSATWGGLVTVWNVESFEKVTEFIAHTDWVCAVDASPDATKITTGSCDTTVCVWSLSGEQLLGPLRHFNTVGAVKFSPDGHLIATATWERDSIRIYDSLDGDLLVDVPIQVNSFRNQSLAWANNSKQLFALSLSGKISCLSVYTGTSLSAWPIHSSDGPKCIILANNGAFIAASGDSSVSFWDTRTHEKIDIFIRHTADIVSMSISSNYDLVIVGGNTIAIHNLCDVLPSPYCDNSGYPLGQLFRELEVSHARGEKSHLEEVDKSLRTREESSSSKVPHPEKTVHGLLDNLTTSRYTAHQKEGSLDEATNPLGAKEESEDEKITHLNNIIRRLHDRLAESHNIAMHTNDTLNETIRSLRADLLTREEIQNEKIANGEKTVHELQNQLSVYKKTANEKENSLNETIDTLRADLSAQNDSSSRKITHLKQTIKDLRGQLVESREKASSLTCVIRVHEQIHRCEFLYTQDRVNDAAQSLLEILNVVNEDLRADEFIKDWLVEFTRKCVISLERVGDEALSAEKQDEASMAYSTALSLGSSTTNTVLIKWVSTMLTRGPVHEAFSAAVKFRIPKFVLYRVICDTLEWNGRITDAIECFRQMQSKLPEDKGVHDERAQWEHDFRGRCVEKLEKLGDEARDANKHDEAIEHYSNALSFDPPNSLDILLKHSNELVELDPSSHKGYQGKHVALHDMRRHSEAFEAFKMMLSKLEQSSDPHIRELRDQYVDATSSIQDLVEETIRHIPRVLIDITTGRLYDKPQQAAAFEELPVYDELRSSMTTQLDHGRIRKEVENFYRYVMFSHRWQPNEPTFQRVQDISIYGLPESPGNGKLQNFCKLVRSLRFGWAWSDTCCVNQLDKGVQQESLVAMFRWYRGSSLTIVHLLGVLSESQEFGCLWKSIWNTRGWTYQEYVASEVVQFYTEDWKPYLGLDVFNHKESPTILSEMERATNFASQELATLQPGLDRVREKLYLASVRKTTREEDIAYSLFGIFNAAIPVIYGEGNQAVGRLLEYILTRSDNVTILAWTGRSGSHHSYLPADLTVYNQIVPQHVPPPIERIELNDMVARLLSSLPDLTQPIALYERLHDLPPLSLVAGRLRLPGIVFPLANLTPLPKSMSDPDLHVYHATTPMLGNVEIKTTENLSGMEGLLLIHPWISPLLDPDFLCGAPRFDLATRALRLVVRLRQPFGALLLAPLARVQYRRVATDSLIMVRVCEWVSLADLMEGVRTVDIQ